MESARVWLSSRARYLWMVMPIVVAALAPTGVLAFPTPGNLKASDLPAPITSATGSSGIEGFLCGALAWVFWGLILLSVVMAIISAYRYVTSGGEPEKVSKAGKTLLYTAIALVVALIAAGLPNIIGSFLGASGSFSACSVFGGGGGGGTVTNFPGA